MSYTQIYYHIVFRTKGSVPAIDPTNEKTLYSFIWGIVREKQGVLYRIGGMPDHVHMFVQLPPTIAVADFMRDVKTATNHLMQRQHDDFPLFGGWAKSYCALTYSIADKEKIVSYIQNQKEHHKQVSLRDELIALLREQHVEFDINYFMKD